MADIITLDPNESVMASGARMYLHPDINVCRAFLRRAGLEVQTGKGWISERRKGAIWYEAKENKWCAWHQNI